MFTLRISSNGQPSIITDVSGIDAYSHYKNDGVRFSLKTYNGMTRDGLAAIVKAAAPGSLVRKVRDGVMVRKPAAMVAACDEVDAAWQSWCREGLTHAEMRHRAINHPAYRAIIDA